MNPLAWNDTFNSGIEILDRQHRDIFNCMTSISQVISDPNRQCDTINDLLDQLMMLCMIHFEYERILMGELKYPSIAMHKDLHDSYISSISGFRIDNNECHTLACLNEFIALRLNFVTILLHESRMLAEFIEMKTSSNPSETGS